jgi:hypothetical protein
VKGIYITPFKILLFVGIFISSCHSLKTDQPENPLFKQLPSSETGISFINQVQPDASFNIFNYHSYYDGGGVAIGDVNNDGWADIFMVSNQRENKLYLNKGNWHFEDVTMKAGLSTHKNWSTGVAMVDVNGDGLLDIYISNNGLKTGIERANQLFINKGVNKNGEPYFTDEATAYGLDDKGMTTQAAFLDYDGDGDLDCFMLNNTLNPNGNFGYSKSLRNAIDTVNGQRLYRNDNGHFINVTTSSKIHSGIIGFGLGIAVGDVNGDKWPDIYIANDFYERDYLYLNNHDGTYSDVIDNEIGHISATSMGTEMTDINNDGLQDILSTDMLPENDYRLKTITRFDSYDVLNAKLANDFHHQFMRNMLQLNNGDGTFSEVGQLAGVEATDWTWGALAFDFNNDGWKDIFVSNGIYKDITDQDFMFFLANDQNMMRVAAEGRFDYKEFLEKIPSVPISNYAFINQDSGLQFKNKSFDLGLGTKGFSSGAAYGDLDNDGDLDLVVNNVNMPAFIYENKANDLLHHNFLRVKLKGEGKNIFGIGAEVTAYAGNQEFVLQQNPQRGFESSMDLTMVFGLGKFERLDSLRIIWPGKEMKMQVLKNVKANQTITLNEKEALDHFVLHHTRETPLYKNVSSAILEGDTRHKENAFIDFKREHLMPLMLSTEGPKCAKADINGDGLEDIFIGGAKNDTGKIFTQLPDGKFKRVEMPALNADKEYEDIGAAFFDANGDGHPDLMVASGGNEANIGSPLLSPRLYVNDGKGHFSRFKSAMPATISLNASCLRPIDFDKDGDIDLFIGGRDVPGNYGITPKSYLLVNDGNGHFTDETDQLAPELRKIGMVTDASWADVDKDGKEDLIVVGEWMPVTIFKNYGNQLKKLLEVPKSSGWWNCITAADLDDDGDIDFVMGNLGLNSLFKADSAHPAQLYINDFDGNGQPEPILTYYKSDGISYPMLLKNDLAAQIPSLNKKFLMYADYAGKTIDQIFTKKQIEGSIKKEASCFQTSLLINEGNNKFHLQYLPVEAQFSPIYSILVKDLDEDGKKDIFLGGNFYSVPPQVGRYDANYGCMLKGEGHNNFTYVHPSKSGLFIKGEVRDITTIQTKKENYIIIARNNDSLQIFERTEN